MRNPAYKDHPLIEIDKFEIVADEKDYWQNLNRDVYRTGLEKTLDFIGSFKSVAEVQVGSGHFTKLLEEYCDLMDISPVFSGTEDYVRSLWNFEVYEEPHMVYTSNVIFLVECLPYMSNWKDELMRLWNSLSRGTKLVIFDTQTPTQFRDALKRYEDAKLIFSHIVDDAPAYINPDGKKRKLKIRVYEKK